MMQVRGRAQYYQFGVPLDKDRWTANWLGGSYGGSQIEEVELVAVPDRRMEKPKSVSRCEPSCELRSSVLRREIEDAAVAGAW